MQSASATVVKVSDAEVQLTVARDAVCARCASGKGCGAGLFGQARKPVSIDVIRPTGLVVTPGDQVDLAIESSAVLRASIAVYGLPLLGLVGLPLIASWTGLADGDASLAVAALAGIYGGFVVGKAWSGRYGCSRQYEPKISIIGRGDSRA